MDTDPKKGRGRLKATLANTPMAAVHLMGLAFNDGAEKYGPFNWRETKVGSTTYLEALKRHILAYEAGEECAVDSGVPHLAHAMASLAILLDAKLHDALVDERRPSRATLDLLEHITSWRGDREGSISDHAFPRPLFEGGL